MHAWLGTAWAPWGAAGGASCRGQPCWSSGRSPLMPESVPRFSALHHAALNGNTELISLLLEAQAAVDIKDNKGECPGPRHPQAGAQGRASAGCPVPGCRHTGVGGEGGSWWDVGAASPAGSCPLPPALRPLAGRVQVGYVLTPCSSRPQACGPCTMRLGKARRSP